MNKYGVIEMIMNSNIADQNYKVYLIQSFLLNWSTLEEVKEAIQNY